MVSVIEGAVTKGFVTAIHALMDFCYLTLAPEIDDDVCGQINHTLEEFHTNKQAILDANAHLGKGNKPIDNWYIPKLKMLQSIILNIRANGTPYQWSADITEHAHHVEMEYCEMLFQLESEHSHKELYRFIAQSRPVQMISY